ncbi:MAG: hypothetical protein Q4F40_02505 [Akkermansia sp.]|nr:hypothetical protein [Akkermansia sp.]
MRISLTAQQSISFFSPKHRHRRRYHLPQADITRAPRGFHPRHRRGYHRLPGSRLTPLIFPPELSRPAMTVACYTTATAGGDITCHRQISPEPREDFTHATGVDITA